LNALYASRLRGIAQPHTQVNFRAASHDFGGLKVAILAILDEYESIISVIGQMALALL